MSFENLVNNPDNVVADTAKMLQHYTEQFQNGEMTQEEYKDLCKDILNEQRIIEIVTDMNRRNEIFKAFQQMYQIVSVIGQFVAL